MDGEDFKQRTYHAMEDEDLTPIEKLVMIAHFLYEGNPGRIPVATRQSEHALNIIERQLMRKDWLASPEG